MVDVKNPVPVSPLQGMESPEDGIALAEVPFVGKVDIRGDIDDPAFADAAAKVIGAPLPKEPNTVSRGNGNTVYWFGPDEWLIHTPSGAETMLVDNLRAVFDGVHAAVTDVSDYYLVIEVTGEHARDALMRGTPLDVHESVFRPGQCAQTVFANASIMLDCVSDAPSYRLQVRWTFARYVWNYLAATARQWGSSDERGAAH